MTSIDALKANMQQVERDLAKLADKIGKEERGIEQLKAQQVKLETKKAGYEAEVARLQAALGDISSKQ